MQIARRVSISLLCVFLLSAGLINRVRAAHATHGANEEPGGGPALTIYNQKFAVVREIIPLDLKTGVNHVEVTDITGHLEPDSVILRALDSNRELQVLEQNYRNDPVSQQLLLSLYEGKTIDFLLPGSGANRPSVQGKIIRSGFVPHSAMAYQNYGQQYYLTQASYAQSGGDQPIIEVNGKLQFTLPGEPVFPALADDTILKPTLSWELETNRPGAMPAEFSYVTEGIMWEASYNVVAPPKGNVLELVGWVTLDNESGKSFRDAHIKLMAGDVNKVEPQGLGVMGRNAVALKDAESAAPTPPVRERTFDEYHLYSLEHTTTLHDREIKQVEFVRAAGIQSKTLYVYDGVEIDPMYRGWNMETIRQQEAFGVKSNPKVWAMQELKNSQENHLGMALPKGRVRFYRRDDDGQLEFTGENEIDHTPKDEVIRLYTGNAFDMTGERHRLQYRLDMNGRWVDESFEIKVRNHKATAVEARVVEHLYRWSNWEITKNSDPFNKVDSQTIEFTVQIPPNGQKTLNYQVHYSW
jgi:hypothetical protein